MDKMVLANYIRLFVTGNADWIVPAGFMERRFAVFDVGEDHIQDHPYFGAIDQEMDNGGREALLYKPLNFDIGQVNLREAPRTEALFDQQMEWFMAEQAWLFEILSSGALPGNSQRRKQPPAERVHQTGAVQQLPPPRQHAPRNRKAIETKLGMFLHKHVSGRTSYQDFKRCEALHLPTPEGVP